MVLPKPPAPGRAFEELLSEQMDPLFRTAVRLSGGHEADAEDLLQEAVLQGFERYHQLRDPAAGRAWLFTILTRTHLNRMRTARRKSETLVTDLGEPEFEAALAAWFDEKSVAADGAAPDDVPGALDRLEPELRATVILVDLEGFRQREAAEMLGVAEGTIASRLFRARRALRHLLTPNPDWKRQEKQR